MWYKIQNGNSNTRWQSVAQLSIKSVPFSYFCLFCRGAKQRLSVFPLVNETMNQQPLENPKSATSFRLIYLILTMQFLRLDDRLHKSQVYCSGVMHYSNEQWWSHETRSRPAMSNPRPSRRFCAARRFCLGFRCSKRILHTDNLSLFWQPWIWHLVLSANLSRLLPLQIGFEQFHYISLS